MPIFPIDMSRKKKKSAAAENLIDSLMDDLKDIQAEASYHAGQEPVVVEALPSLDVQAIEAVSAQPVNPEGNLWESLENGLANEIDSSEFNGGAEEVAANASEYEVPEGFADLNLPSVGESPYDGPSLEGGYQSSDDISMENFALPKVKTSKKSAVQVVNSAEAGNSSEDKTVSIQQDISNLSSVTSSSVSDSEKTLAVEGFARTRAKIKKSTDADVKVSVGSYRGSSAGGGRSSGNVMTSVDASLAQAENLNIAQQRILELEKEVEHLREENEELASAGEIIRSRADELSAHMTKVEKEKAEIQESAKSELLILKGNLQYKENEVAKARVKVDELEARLKSDFKKIRVRERELENRLELLRAEKSALVRSKDEYILEQKRKIDQLSQELDNYREKCLELNKALEGNQDQFKRTERALRLALSNLEAKEENTVPLKKAE